MRGDAGRGSEKGTTHRERAALRGAGFIDHQHRGLSEKLTAKFRSKQCKGKGMDGCEVGG